MRALFLFLLFVTGALRGQAACPDMPAGSSEPPRVSLSFTGVPGEVAIAIVAPAPTCIVTIELATQGPPVPHAALLGDAETHAASVRRVSGGLQSVRFLVNALIPAGETRYLAWYPATPWYATLGPDGLTWSRGGPAQHAPSLPAIVGALRAPARHPARRSRSKRQ